eukprot:CAMPEP_0197176660 /NCGR_PEP_ID=MMETSP1423-20130617/2509_1 /TAXON_ID=476441 /ORGANISM="Pseudo-nitzschia heimii, Strain UNC1101" /LENGTH=395 /DNA_ID=CAMNT_0042626059 /DNA_START=170 /DNA_END=1357 /DNA_ORIENTATION=+
MTIKSDGPAVEAAIASDEVDQSEEEFWPISSSLLTGHKVHTIRLGGGCDDVEDSSSSSSSIVLRYMSMPSEAMTPLDMVYGGIEGQNEGLNDVSFQDDEFYDGTGNLMWMAAVCFGHLVAQKVEPLWSYLFGEALGPELGVSHAKKRRFCELGCGTGGAGISLLLCHNKRDVSSINNSSSCHVVFTDNDAQSLDLCASNCQLNNLDPKSYSQKLLGWGSESSYRETTAVHQISDGEPLEPRSFDVVLATDVVYDLKMIGPLLQTVDWLLKENSKSEEDGSASDGGHLILSHVPRFCIPTESDDSDSGNRQQVEESDNQDNPTEAFLELERFIEAEARKVGLVLAERIRPHQVLSEDKLANPNDQLIEHGDDDSMQRLTLEMIKEAHAVLFIFRRS